MKVKEFLAEQIEEQFKQLEPEIGEDGARNVFDLKLRIERGEVQDVNKAVALLAAIQARGILVNVLNKVGSLEEPSFSEQDNDEAKKTRAFSHVLSGALASSIEKGAPWANLDKMPVEVIEEHCLTLVQLGDVTSLNLALLGLVYLHYQKSVTVTNKNLLAQVTPEPPPTSPRAA